MQELASQLTGAGPASVFLAAFLGPYLFPAAGELAVVAAIGLGLDPLLVFALGFAGSVASDQLGYVIGRVGGSPIANRMLLPERRAELEERVHRHAFLALVPGRMIPGARTWIAILAGIARLPWRRFAALNAAGCVLWSAVLVVVGVVFGATVDVEAVIDGIRHWQLPIFVFVCGLFGARMLYVRRQRRA
jgi:membrane protein DedA with SNARE-associated domain